jgi:hypothetical protein
MANPEVPAKKRARANRPRPFFLSTGLIHHGLLPGHHPKGAALGGCLVENDISDNILPINKNLNILRLGRGRHKRTGIGDHRIRHVGLEIAVDHINTPIITHWHLLGRWPEERDDLRFCGLSFFNLGEGIGVDLPSAVGATDEGAKRQNAEESDQGFHWVW